MRLRASFKESPLANKIQCERLKLEQLMKSPSMRHPLDKINQKKMDLEILRRSIAEAMSRKVEKKRESFGFVRKT